MTGPEHYKAAEQHLKEAFACTEDQNYLSDWNQRQAQVHATLAVAAATALCQDGGHDPAVSQWLEAAS